MLGPWKSHFIQANGIRIHYVTMGQGPLVVLLHGFPEYWYAWRHQIPVLAEHFQVVVPDLRGYGDTDKPSQVSGYQPSSLTADVQGLIHALGFDKAHLVGHDWGGAIAWRVALNHPEVIDRLAVLNCPHPALFAKALRSNPRQMLRSWYMFFFQIPYLPEWTFRTFSKSLVELIFRRSSVRRDTFSDEDLMRYREAIEKPGVLTAMFNYYRAARLGGTKKTGSGRDVQKISTPTLFLWGENDSVFRKELTYGMESLFSGPFHLQYVPDCSHWIMEEQPEWVNRSLLRFLS